MDRYISMRGVLSMYGVQILRILFGGDNYLPDGRRNSAPLISDRGSLDFLHYRR